MGMAVIAADGQEIDSVAEVVLGRKAGGFAMEHGLILVKLDNS
jgi:hypothetical protein